MTKIIVEIPYYHAGSDKYEQGWNNCLNEIKRINNVLEKQNEIRFEEVCLMSPECNCEDCQKENVKMD